MKGNYTYILQRAQQDTYPDKFDKLFHNKDMDKGDRCKNITTSHGLILCVIKHSLCSKREKATLVTHSKGNVPTDSHFRWQG